jgi:hypothetical protein
MDGVVEHYCVPKAPTSGSFRCSSEMNTLGAIRDTRAQGKPTGHGLITCREESESSVPCAIFPKSSWNNAFERAGYELGVSIQRRQGLASCSHVAAQFDPEGVQIRGDRSAEKAFYDHGGSHLNVVRIAPPNSARPPFTWSPTRTA